MIDNIEEKEKEVKTIWFENRDKMPSKEIFVNLLKDYFNGEDIGSKLRVNKDWLFFLSWIRKWRGVEKKKEQEERTKDKLENLTDEKIEELQSMNRKKMIVILSNLIENYEKETNPVHLSFGIGEIRRMYGAIQSLEEKMKTTEIARGKLKLDAVRTLLPYKRMSTEELTALRGKLNESFDRINKLKSGEFVGRPTPNSG